MTIALLIVGAIVLIIVMILLINIGTSVAALLTAKATYWEAQAEEIKRHTAAIYPKKDAG
jgi:hypothetical protein